MTDQLQPLDEPQSPQMKHAPARCIGTPQVMQNGASAEPRPERTGVDGRSPVIGSAGASSAPNSSCATNANGDGIEGKDFYDGQGKYRGVDGVGSIEDITERLVAVIESL